MEGAHNFGGGAQERGGSARERGEILNFREKFAQALQHLGQSKRHPVSCFVTTANGVIFALLDAPHGAELVAVNLAVYGSKSSLEWEVRRLCLEVILSPVCVSKYGGECPHLVASKSMSRGLLTLAVSV